jgi:putative hydrolase of the HAD superfamily
MKLPLDGLPEAVTFDCWNTLLYEEDWTHAHARRVGALHEAATEGGHPATREQVGAAFDMAWQRHMNLWRREQASGAPEVATWALEILKIEPAGIAYDHLVAHWQEVSHTSHVLPLAGARDLLATLRERGVRTALICDTGLTPGRVVRQHLERHGLLEHLELQAFSDEVGVPKPRPEIFCAALEPLAVAPGRSVHVGDLKRTDVAGGRNAGMLTVRITDRHDDTSHLAEADGVVASHATLAEGLVAQG